MPTTVDAWGGSWGGSWAAAWSTAVSAASPAVATVSGGGLSLWYPPEPVSAPRPDAVRRKKRRLALAAALWLLED